MISKNSVIVKQWKNAQKININKLLAQIVKDNEQELVDINRDQMRKGDAGDGKIDPDYDPSYLSYKKELPSYFGGGKPDLFLTGSFQDAMYLDVKGSMYEFDSRDNKTTKILNKYGDTIFDLNPDNLELARDLIIPQLNKAVHNILNG